ncbi:hypothetical protein KSP39_PZI001530 [Platanthera zijinensis]|uniref:RimM N-terminal domain-containing protein n=1 Tax=Platanthera zijinensis TaxID=2320716 RepID=A0AAP0GFH6_9ASPA
MLPSPVSPSPSPHTLLSSRRSFFPCPAASALNFFGTASNHALCHWRRVSPPLCAAGPRAIAEVVTGSRKDAKEEEDLSDLKFIDVGFISSVHGLKGELRVKPNTGFPELRFCKPGKRWLRARILGRETISEVQLTGGRNHPGQKCWIISFEGVDTVDKGLTTGKVIGSGSMANGQYVLDCSPAQSPVALHYSTTHPLYSWHYRLSRPSIPIMKLLFPAMVDVVFDSFVALPPPTSPAISALVSSPTAELLSVPSALPPPTSPTATVPDQVVRGALPPSALRQVQRPPAPQPIRVLPNPNTASASFRSARAASLKQIPPSSRVAFNNLSASIRLCRCTAILPIASPLPHTSIAPPLVPLLRISFARGFLTRCRRCFVRRDPLFIPVDGSAHPSTAYGFQWRLRLVHCVKLLRSLLRPAMPPACGVQPLRAFPSLLRGSLLPHLPSGGPLVDSSACQRP